MTNCTYTVYGGVKSLLPARYNLDTIAAARLRVIPSYIIWEPNFNTPKHFPLWLVAKKKQTQNIYNLDANATAQLRLYSFKIILKPRFFLKLEKNFIQKLECNAHQILWYAHENFFRKKIYHHAQTEKFMHTKTFS